MAQHWLTSNLRLQYQPQWEAGGGCLFYIIFLLCQYLWLRDPSTPKCQECGSDGQHGNNILENTNTNTGKEDSVARMDIWMFASFVIFPHGQKWQFKPGDNDNDGQSGRVRKSCKYENLSQPGNFHTMKTKWNLTEMRLCCHFNCPPRSGDSSSFTYN